jgi:hypothetical protein
MLLKAMAEQKYHRLENQSIARAELILAARVSQNREAEAKNKIMGGISHDTHAIESDAAAAQGVIDSGELPEQAAGYRIVTETEAEFSGGQVAAKSKISEGSCQALSVVKPPQRPRWRIYFSGPSRWLSLFHKSTGAFKKIF